MLSAALTLDTLGERYGLLPSEVLMRGNTLDIQILDIALAYHDHQERRARGEAPRYTQEELKAIMGKHRSAVNG